MRGVWTAVVIGVCLCLPPATVRAETSDAAKAQAQAALRAGNALLEQGRPSDALSKFTEAYRLFPSPKLHYNIGQAESLIPGHEARAYDAMSRFLREAKDANPKLHAAAETACQQLRPKVGLVSVTADPPDAELFVDDAGAGKVSPGTPLVLGAGKHTLAIKKDGAASAGATVTIAGGEASEVRLRLAPPVAPPALVAKPAPAPAPPQPRAPVLVPALTTPAVAAPPASLVQAAPPPPARGYWTGRRRLGVALVAAGAASLVFGVVEHVRYFSKADDFRNRGCGTDNLAVGQDCKGLNDDFKSARTLWIAGYAAAAALGAAGGYALWLAPADQPGAAEGRGVASVNPGGTINLGGRF